MHKLFYKMRLGQLARQLDTKPEKIVAFLEKTKKLTIKEHPNSKVDDELIDELTAHFKPVVEEMNVVEETKVVKKEKKKEVEKETPVVHVEPEHIETVKIEPAQKLKIIGKIDLPNKAQINVEVDGVVYDQETLDNKKKEEIKAERERKEIEKEEKRKEEEEKKRLVREKREIEQERQKMLETEKHNILTKEEERKKEIILKAQQKREAELEEKRKERQREHYAQKASPVNSNPTAKKKKVVAKQAPKIVVETNTIRTENTPKVEVIVEVREKSVFKRFIKWLNT